MDIFSFLEEHNIEHRTGGKNVTKGWVEINCPYCFDPSFHLGINLNSGVFHCWICGEKGSPTKLIKKLLGVSYAEAQRIEKEFDSTPTFEEHQKKHVAKIQYPKGTEKDFPAPHREYLIHRGFDPDQLIEKYQLKACSKLGGAFAYRIIIPIIIDGQVVSYTSRDITGKQKSKYENLSNDKSIMSVKDSIYNIDTVTDKCIIVEGVMDVWRIGEGCIALFGTEHTATQLNLLFSKNIKEAYIMFDGDATKKAHKLGSILSTFIPSVSVIELGEGDPADLSDEEINPLVKKIFGKEL